MGSERYTWASINDLDHLLVQHFDGQRAGLFLEIGANDGLQQSNTLALEVLYDWRGILVEANPSLAAECRRNRPNARVVCAAASASLGLLQVTDDDLMGRVTVGDGAISVPAVPLSMIIEARGFGQRLDLISLDVEGHELEVLEGLDLERHGPECILVETNRLQHVRAALEPRYRQVARWSSHDYVFVRASG